MTDLLVSKLTWIGERLRRLRLLRHGHGRGIAAGAARSVGRDGVARGARRTDLLGAARVDAAHALIDRHAGRVGRGPVEARAGARGDGRRHGAEGDRRSGGRRRRADRSGSRRRLRRAQGADLAHRLVCEGVRLVSLTALAELLRLFYQGLGFLELRGTLPVLPGRPSLLEGLRGRLHLAGHAADENSERDDETEQQRGTPRSSTHRNLLPHYLLCLISPAGPTCPPLPLNTACTRTLPPRVRRGPPAARRRPSCRAGPSSRGSSAPSGGSPGSSASCRT